MSDRPTDRTIFSLTVWCRHACRTSNKRRCASTDGALFGLDFGLHQFGSAVRICFLEKWPENGINESDGAVVDSSHLASSNENK